MPRTTTPKTGRRSPRKTTKTTGELTTAERKRLKLSPEVAWYLQSRGIPYPDCPPLWKTPEAGEVLRSARFDPDRVDKVLDAFRHLRHTKGKWAGRPLNPDPWQVAYVIAPAFGWLRKNDSGDWVRVVRELYVDVSRRNGKSTLLGGLGIYMTAADGEQGAEVIAAATTKDQAQFVFGPVKTLAVKSPALKDHVRALTGVIHHPATGSTFKVISNVADAQHGANVHCAVVDELHVHKDREMVDTLETGMGSRDQPMACYITTADAGKPNTIYAEKRERVERLARRVITNPAIYGAIWAAEYEDQFGERPFLEDTWRKANPGFGISPTREYLADKAAKARESPAELASFLRLHLGIRTKQVTRFIPLEDWDATAGMVTEDELAGLPCRGGLDLASVEDLTALCWTFRTEGTDDYRTIWRFWVPEARVPKLDQRTAGQASVWVRQGWLTTTPGNVIDNDAIVSTILADADRFDVESIGYDRWGANDVVRRLTDEGLVCVPVSQGYAALTAPMKELLRLVLRRTYVHGGNPVMRWCMDNLAVAMDPAGNVKPDRENSADKIDGVAAAVNALSEHLAAEAEEENVILR